MQIQIQKKNILYTYTILPDKKHLIYKTNIMQHCTEILNTKTDSNGKHFLHIYSFCVGNKKCMVIFSILIQYFRYFVLPFILGLSPKHLHLYK
jgi:hypothetical protein